MLDQGALLLLLEHDDGQQQLLSMQEALHMMVRRPRACFLDRGAMVFITSALLVGNC